jgi:hypothetical protein
MIVTPGCGLSRGGPAGDIGSISGERDHPHYQNREEHPTRLLYEASWQHTYLPGNVVYWIGHLTVR